MRSLLRPIATCLLAAGVATCSDTPIATVKSSASPAGIGRAALSLQPVFSRSAQQAADFGVTFDSVHIVIRGLPDTTRIVLDTTIVFRPDSPDLRLNLSVPVRTEGEHFDAGLGYTLGGVIQFYGHGTVQSHAPNAPPPPEPQILINYQGPGARVARLTISPRTTTLLGTQSSTLTVAAFDSSGASMSLPPLLWSTSNASIVSVSASGGVQGQNRRGTATITVQSPTGISDNVPVGVTLPAASIALVSGGGQTGNAGATLSNPGVVQVNASDGIGVAGASVIFAAPAGGAVSPTTATTDANGRASVSLTLGGTVGPQSFSATSAGFSVAIPATATAAAPSAIAIVAGNNQTDSIRKTLAPLSVRVTDRFGNAASGVSVAWARTAGSGSLASPTSTTNADGIATNTYTLGSTPGPEGVSASITGASVAFSFTTSAGGPAAIAAVSGGGQTGRVGQPLAAAFVVRVTDAGGNPASNATVFWSATNGSIVSGSTTDAAGQASATLNGGLALGPAGATARIANGQSVTFSATLQAGSVSQMLFTTQPVNGTPNVALAPVRVGLRDGGGNATAGTNAVTIALGNNPNGAALSGTLTRNAVSGVATFDDLKLDKAGSGYTLTATSTGLTSVTSSAFSTSVGAAAQLILVPSTPTTFTKAAGGAVPNPPTLKTADAAGNAVGNTAVLFTVTQGATTIGTQTLNSDASGFINAASINTPDVVGTYTITGSLVSTPSVTLSVTLNVTAGAADHLALTGSAAAAADIGAGITTFPAGASVNVQDAFNNAVNNATVSWTTSSPCASGFTLGSGSSTSNSSGDATSPSLTVPNNVAGSCRVTASIGAGPGKTATFYAVMKPSGSDAWIGTSDNTYGTSTNWTGGAPTSSSAVYIAAALPQQPALGADGVAGSVTLETGANASLSLNTKALTVSGSVISNSGGINNGTLKVEGSIAASIVGVLPTTVIGNATACGTATYTLSGATLAGPVTLNCPLVIGANSLTTTNGGGLTVTGTSGKLMMSNASGFVDVAGPTTFQAGSTSGTMTAGTLRLRGNFQTLLLHDLSDVYAPSGNHVTEFAGTSPQTVDMCLACSNGSAFNNAKFDASSDVYFSNNASFTGTFDVGANAELATGLSTTSLTVNGNVTTAASSDLTGVMEMILTGGTRFPIFPAATASPAKVTMNADLSMTSGATIGGDLVLNKQLTVGAQTLTVNNLSTATSGGKLNMTTAGGLVVVKGSASFAGASTDNLLTNGTLEVHGDLSQSNVLSSNSFRATGSHLTKLNGTGAQSIFFTSTAGSSQFNDLSIENTSASGVTFTSIGNAGRDLLIGASGGATTKLTLQQTFNVGRDLQAKAGAAPIQSGVGKRIIVSGAVLGDALADLGGVDSVKIVGTTFPVYNNTTAGKAPRVTHLTNDAGGTMNVAANGTIAGGLSIQRPLSLNGKALVVKDSFLLGPSSSFDMSNTAGTLTIGGNFTENGGSMNPSSGSLVTLNGTGTQLISFSNASDNFFGSLDITNTSSGGVQLSTNAATNGNLRVRAAAKLSVPASKTLTVGPAFTLFLHNNSTIDVAGTVSFSTCQKGTGVTITGAGSSGLSTGCSSSGSLP